MSLSYQSLNEAFAVAPQLMPEDMQTLADAGFKAVIINRPDGEGGAEQPTSAAVMDAARAAGLQVRYQPVVSGSITQADVVEFSQLLHTLPAPILAFCRSGARCTNLYQSAQEHDAGQNPG